MRRKARETKRSLQLQAYADGLAERVEQAFCPPPKLLFDETKTGRLGSKIANFGGIRSSYDRQQEVAEAATEQLLRTFYEEFPKLHAFFKQPRAVQHVHDELAVNTDYAALEDRMLRYMRHDAESTLGLFSQWPKSRTCQQQVLTKPLALSALAPLALRELRRRVLLFALAHSAA